MKQLTFDKNSWHYKLATKVASYSPVHTDEDGYECGFDNADICTYTKHVVGGALLLAVVGAFIAFAGFVLWHVIFGFWFSYLYGHLMFSDIAIAALMFGAITGGAVIFAFCVAKFKKLKRKPINPDSFVGHAYRSWKDKFCVKVNFVDVTAGDDENRDYGGGIGGA